MFKYKVGQKVKIIPNLSINGRYFMHSGPENKNYWCHTNVGVNNEMMAMAGQVFTISECTGYGVYHLKEDGEQWSWVDDMLVLPKPYICKSLL